MDLPIGIERELEKGRGGYIYPFEATNPPSEVYRPFAKSNNFRLNNATISFYGKTLTAKQILKKAIMSVFNPLTEQTPIFAHIREGSQTSSIKIDCPLAPRS
jgi:hypothetical protein